MNILITGGAGFIGSNFVHYMLKKYPQCNILVVDKLTYAGNFDNLKTIGDKITFVKEDICNIEKMKELISRFKIDTIVNFAAQTSVEKSFKEPEIFEQANVTGTKNLIESAKQVWGEDSQNKFVQISIDKQQEETSPYRKTKIQAEEIALSSGLNVCVANCSNNYGPYQHNEKLIPHMIACARNERRMPVYGDGETTHDWIYVEDTCRAIDAILELGQKGESYNICSTVEKQNKQIVKIIVDRLHKKASLIENVEERQGMQSRHSQDITKTKELGWKTKTPFEENIIKTIDWYVSHPNYLETK